MLTCRFRVSARLTPRFDASSSKAITACGRQPKRRLAGAADVGAAGQTGLAAVGRRRSRGSARCSVVINECAANNRSDSPKIDADIVSRIEAPTRYCRKASRPSSASRSSPAGSEGNAHARVGDRRHITLGIGLLGEHIRVDAGRDGEPGSTSNGPKWRVPFDRVGGLRTHGCRRQAGEVMSNNEMDRGFKRVPPVRAKNRLNSWFTASRLMLQSGRRPTHEKRAGITHGGSAATSCLKRCAVVLPRTNQLERGSADPTIRSRADRLRRQQLFEFDRVSGSDADASRPRRIAGSSPDSMCLHLSGCASCASASSATVT